MLRKLMGSPALPWACSLMWGAGAGFVEGMGSWFGSGLFSESRYFRAEGVGLDGFWERREMT
jgi:hypothetical protein